MSHAEIVEFALRCAELADQRNEHKIARDMLVIAARTLKRVAPQAAAEARQVIITTDYAQAPCS